MMISLEIIALFPKHLPCKYLQKGDIIRYLPCEYLQKGDIITNTSMSLPCEYLQKGDIIT